MRNGLKEGSRVNIYLFSSMSAEVILHVMILAGRGWSEIVVDSRNQSKGKKPDMEGEV